MLMNVHTKLVAKDRTADFQAIVERLRAEGPASATQDPGRASTSSGSQHAQFSAKAQAMSMRISQLATRIQSLTRLAKQSTMYNDNSQQIHEMTAQVKTGLTGLNDELQELQAMSRRGGASGQGGSHSTRVVDNLRVQLNGTTSRFKSVLEVRRETLKASEDRRTLFTSSVQAADEYQTSFFEDGPSTDAGTSNSETQALIQTTAPQADSYLQSRDEALTQINSTIQDLGGIFNQMAEMVQQQGELAVRIDDNVDNVVENVDAAQVQLLKYLQTISSNRWLALKVFSILIVFVLLFIFIS